MTSVAQTNGESSDWTRTRRVFIEHDIRPVKNADDPSTIDSAIRNIAKQHQDEKEELKELNSKLSNYLEHVQHLETYNGHLLAELDEVRKKEEKNTEKITRKYAPELRKVRRDLDDGLHARILYELQFQQYEYDIGHAQQRIDAFDGDTAVRLKAIEQELANSIYELDILKKQFDRREAELSQQRLNLQNLDNLFEGLEKELLNHQLERLLVQNEIQTIREELAFENANYQVQRQEIVSLSTKSFSSFSSTSSSVSFCRCSTT